MPITLITGKPGAGKTLAAVKMIVEDLLPTGRPIYAQINGLQYDALGVLRLVADDQVQDAAARVAALRHWHELPDGAVIIIDECQDVFPPRNPAAACPEYIRKFETHRHRGHDVVLLTQGPRLIDRHLHDLIDRHIHLFRLFGLRRSTKFEWPGVNLSPDPEQSRDTARRAFFSFPRKYFQFYQSATLHTVQRRIPWAPFAVLLAAAIIVPTLIFITMGRLRHGRPAAPSCLGAPAAWSACGWPGRTTRWTCRLTPWSRPATGRSSLALTASSSACVAVGAVDTARHKCKLCKARRRDEH